MWLKTNEQTNKQTNKQTTKKQTNKQTKPYRDPLKKVTWTQFRSWQTKTNNGKNGQLVIMKWTVLILTVRIVVIVCWRFVVGCFTSQQHACVSQGWICSDNCACCHTEIEAASRTFHLTQSQHTDTGPTSPGPDIYRQAPDRVATGASIFTSLMWLDLEKGPRESNPGLPVTRPARASPVYKPDF